MIISSLASMYTILLMRQLVVKTACSWTTAVGTIFDTSSEIDVPKFIRDTGCPGIIYHRISLLIIRHTTKDIKFIQFRYKNSTMPPSPSRLLVSQPLYLF